MESKRTVIGVDGMTCGSCEARVAAALGALKGVDAVSVNLESAEAVVEHGDGVTRADLEAAVAGAGYSARVPGRGAAGNAVALGIGVALSAAYLWASAAGAFNALPAIDSSVGYAMLVVAGLLTSVHCVAMCGGIALSQGLSTREPGAGRPGALARATPAFLYNAGRVTSYTASGALAGALGSAFGLPQGLKVAIAAAAGVFMVLFGLKNLGLIRSLPRLPSVLPKPASKKLESLARFIRGRGPFFAGLLNGLMPCGPLQAMQLYALGTGSAAGGALAMFLFGVGTMPLMLGFTAFASFLPRRIVPAVVKAGAVLVMTLGVVTTGRAAALAGVPSPVSFAAPRAVDAAYPGDLPGGFDPSLAVPGADRNAPVATVSGGTQTVVTEFRDGGYVPFTVYAGIPLKWIIRIKAEDLYGCNNALVVPAYGVRKRLQPGDNLVEFTPTKTGVVGYTCWMGMISSRITVAPAPAAPTGR